MKTINLERNFKKKSKQFSEEELSRIVRMCWEDRTSFENIKSQFGISQNEAEKIMRSQIGAKAFFRWRRRIFEQGHLKHEKKSGVKSLRFKCSRQSVDGVTKGWK